MRNAKNRVVIQTGAKLNYICMVARYPVTVNIHPAWVGSTNSINGNDSTKKAVASAVNEKTSAFRLLVIKAHSKIVGCYRLFESSVHQPVFNFDPVQLFQHRLRAEPEEDERGNRTHQIDRDAGDVITHDDLPVDRIRPHKR